MAKKAGKSETGIDRKTLFQYLKSVFYITTDTDEKGTVESITRSMEFRGTSVWTLICAIFIASLGLNTNSTAVIIGAMLISPLMGPIMGAGLSLGIYDFDMLRKALRNLAIMTLISVTTSTLYFLISPLSDAQSELLARTYPTVYDVLIAVFGGAAGIIAGSRKDRVSNAIPGVAIATALMPPLCTAGYGIATGNAKFFLGAFYLYVINSVFIGLSTYVAVKYLKFKRKAYIDKILEKKFHRYIAAISLALILPSVFMAYDVISESTFRKNANRYIDRNFQFEQSRVVHRNFVRTPTKKVIEVTVMGEPLSKEIISHLELLLDKHNLAGTRLKIIQNTAGAGAKVADSMKTKDEKIVYLEERLRDLTDTDRLIKRAVREVNILFPSVDSVSFGDLAIHKVGDLSSEKGVSVLVKWKYPVAGAEKKRLELYLRSRLELESLTVLEVR